MPTNDDSKKQGIAHGDPVANAEEFAAERAAWRSALATDQALREQAIALQVAADRYRYTYTYEWLGVPVIRLPDDIVVLQELFWEYRPERVVETGIARGGSLLLDASLMRLSGQAPSVLGIDLKIFSHAQESIETHPLAEGVEIIEADSVSDPARSAVARFVSGAERALLILDSNHTHEHVLSELRLLAQLMPVGSFILVADTLIEELPHGYFQRRPWDRGNNPATAVQQFLTESADYVLDHEWSRRALVSEFRDGIIRRIR